MQKGGKMNWGILGAGSIAGKFADALKVVEGAERYCVASRDRGRAEQFAARYGFRKYYGSYEEMARDPEVDIIYIATPHSHHLEHATLCLEAGKNVLCEKAFSINRGEVELMTDLAAQKNLFLMEALWPPFQPSYIKAEEVINSGLYGKILHIRSKFSFKAPYDPQARTFNPALAGGALLDIGIYPVMDALRILGMPDSIEAVATKAPTGVDSSVTALFYYGSGATAELHGSFLCDDGIATEVIMERGRVVLSRGRDRFQKLETGFYGEVPETTSFRTSGGGFEFEIEEVMRCIGAGKRESDVVPHSFSLNLMQLMDEIRVKAGIVYDGR